MTKRPDQGAAVNVKGITRMVERKARAVPGTRSAGGRLEINPLNLPAIANVQRIRAEFRANKEEAA